MKLRITLVGLLLASTVHAQVIFDDFSGSSINSSLWTVSTPFGDSSVTESGGNAVFNNRGRIVSTAALPSDFTLTGRFAFTGSAFDHFRIVMFTDGVQSLASGEMNGLTLQFFIQSDFGNTNRNINIEEANFSSGAPAIGAATVPISLNTFYDFELTKLSTQLTVYFNDNPTPIITANSTYTNVGAYLAMYNREGAVAGSSISAGSQVQLDSISAVPEPSMFGLIFLSGTLTFGLRKCIKTSKQNPHAQSI